MYEQAMIAIVTHGVTSFIHFSFSLHLCNLGTVVSVSTTVIIVLVVDDVAVLCPLYKSTTQKILDEWLFDPVVIFISNLVFLNVYSPATS